MVNGKVRTMSKCMWCGKKSHEVKEVMVLSTGPFADKQDKVSIPVCPEHEGKLRRFFDRVRRNALLFIVLTLAFTFSLPISGALMCQYSWAGHLFCASFSALGLVMIVFPFCSPGTFKFMSIATSIKFVRIMGGIIFALGSIGIALGFPCG